MSDALNQYRLSKTAVALRRFTVFDLVSVSGVDLVSAKAFLSRLDKKNSGWLTRTSSPAKGEGRPRVIYSLTPLGLEYVTEKIAPYAREFNQRATKELSSEPIEKRVPSRQPQNWWEAFASDLVLARSMGARTLYLRPGERPTVWFEGASRQLDKGQVWTYARLEEAIHQSLTPWQNERLRTKGTAIAAFDVREDERWLFRVGLLDRAPSVELRRLPSPAPTLRDLHLPGLVEELSKLDTGFVLMTGVSGSGRSKVLAAAIGDINEKQDKRIVTLEEPVLWVIAKGRSHLEQRQVSVDVPGFASALNQALGDRADVLAVSELEDDQTVSMALTAARRGLVFCGITATDPEEALRKIDGFFPEQERPKIRKELSSVLTGVISVAGYKLEGTTDLFPVTAALRTDDEIRVALEDPAQSNIIMEKLKVDSPTTRSFEGSISELHKNQIFVESAADNIAASVAQHSFHYVRHSG